MTLHGTAEPGVGGDGPRGRHARRHHGDRRRRRRLDGRAGRRRARLAHLHGRGQRRGRQSLRALGRRRRRGRPDRRGDADAQPHRLRRPPPLPPPVEGQKVNAQTKSGTVKIKLPGSNKFIVLGAGQQVPVGDHDRHARHGRHDADHGRQRQGRSTPTSTRASSRSAQTKGAQPLTMLTLTGAKPTCSAKASAAAEEEGQAAPACGAAAPARSARPAPYSSATVRGTTWLTQDTCAGTLTKVTQGVVAVRDRVSARPSSSGPGTATWRGQEAH